MTRPRPVIARLLDSIVEVEDGHWRWTKALTRAGYGSFTRSSGSHQLAHRAMWEALCGPIPLGLVLDHLCGMRDCVNPAHLRPVTREENSSRRLGTTCNRGHPRTEDNTMISPSGRRRCRQCTREGYGARRRPTPKLEVQPEWLRVMQTDYDSLDEPLPPCPSCGGLIVSDGFLSSQQYSDERGPAKNRLARCLHCGGNFRSDPVVGAPWERWVWPWHPGPAGSPEPSPQKVDARGYPNTSRPITPLSQSAPGTVRHPGSKGRRG